MSNLKEQQNLEQAHSKGAENFFLDRVKFVLSEKNITKQEIVSILKNINLSENLTEKEFEIVGAISYLVGIDFNGQQYLNNVVCSNVSERMEVFGITPQILKEYINIVSSGKLNIDKIIPAKDSMKNRILEPVFTPVHGVDLKKMIYDIREIIKESTIPVNIALNVSDIIKKPAQDMNYDDILKLNTVVTQNLKYLGFAASKKVFDLYSTPYRLALLKKASEHFHNQKYTIMYFDCTITVLENFPKFKLSDVLDLFVKGGISDERFVEIEAEYDEKLAKLDKDSISASKKIDTEKFPTLKEYSDYERMIDQNVINDMMTNDPMQFLLETLYDYCGKVFKTSEDLYLVLDTIGLSDTEFAQHLYKYVKHYHKMILTTENTEALWKEITPISILKFAEIVKSEIEIEQEKYKTLAGKLYAEIPAETITKINKLSCDCIKYLVLETEQQKQYLMSQQSTNSITTFNHLQQILSLIESCDILGRGISTYSELYEYCMRHTEMKAIIDETAQMPNIENHVSFLRGFSEFFMAILNKLESKTEE